MSDFSPGKDSIDKPPYVASHDSATGMLLALSSFLRGEAFEGLGAVPANELYATFINSIPASWRKKLYTWSGKFPAISESNFRDVDAPEIDRWVCDLYPQKKYPAIAIGSCNGAAIHFCAAMGIPWLPQTVLIPVDKGETFPVDEPKKTMEWAKKPVEEFLQRNEDWQMHHMMDPNQDRLRVGSVAYFRVKKLGLGKYYRNFIEERLEPGGKIIVIDCKFSWPVHQISHRHYFQFGGLGGLTPEAYYHGSEKVSHFLKEVGSDFERWDAPQPNSEMPEAEWGMAASMGKEVHSYAKENNFTLSTISFSHPQDLSAPVAEFFRWWYRQEETRGNSLLVETFNMISPFLAHKKRCVPYWLAFIAENSAADLEAYLDSTKPFDDIYMMILSHGKNSAGSTSIARWKSLMERARDNHSFIGTDPGEYPLDLAVYARYSRQLREEIPGEYEDLPFLSVDEALQNLRRFAGGSVEVRDQQF